MIRTTISALAIFAALAAGTAAQNASAPPAAIAESEQQLLDMKDLIEQGLRLKSETESELAALGEKQKVLETILKDAKGARQFVDELISLLRATAARLSPEGAYAKTLQEQEELVRGLADAARSSRDPTDHPYGAQLDAQARTIGAMRAEARELGGRLAAQVDRLERSKSQIGYAYAIKRTDEFIRNARAFLDAAERVLRGTSGLADKAGAIVAPVVPTQ